jgi:hypothetical protein
VRRSSAVIRLFEATLLVSGFKGIFMVVRAEVAYRRSSLTLVDHALGSLCLLRLFAVLEPDWNDGPDVTITTRNLS